MHRRLITRGYNLELYVFNDSLIATFWEVMGFEHTDTILPSRSTDHFFRMVSLTKVRSVRQIAPVSHQSSSSP